MSTIKGKVHKKFEIETFSSGFQKQTLVVETTEQYPQKIAIEFLSDKIDLLANLKVDQEVIVHINIRGREWTSPEGEVKYFNSITGWKIDAWEVPGK